jgi:hypothetical protein
VVVEVVELADVVLVEEEEVVDVVLVEVVVDPPEAIWTLLEAVAEEAPIARDWWPVKTPVVDAPPEEVSVTDTVKFPEDAYVCVAVGVVVVTVCDPSPKFHTYDAMDP